MREKNTCTRTLLRAHILIGSVRVGVTLLRLFLAVIYEPVLSLSSCTRTCTVTAVIYTNMYCHCRHIHERVPSLPSYTRTCTGIAVIYTNVYWHCRHVHEHVLSLPSYTRTCRSTVIVQTCTVDAITYTNTTSRALLSSFVSTHPQFGAENTLLVTNTRRTPFIIFRSLRCVGVNGNVTKIVSLRSIKSHFRNLITFTDSIQNRPTSCRMVQILTCLYRQMTVNSRPQDLLYRKRRLITVPAL